MTVGRALRSACTSWGDATTTRRTCTCAIGPPFPPATSIDSCVCLSFQRCDHLSQCDQAMGFLHVQVLDQAAIDDDHSLALGGSLGVGGDDLAGRGQVVWGWREDAVGSGDS